MNLLAIDTSTSSTVLGLQCGEVLLDRSVQDVKTHSREILPSIAALLDESGLSLDELDAIIFGQGPGSFTGLRIAVGVVQGLAYGAGLPVVPVSSMAVLAQELDHEGPIFVALSARLEEIYHGSYRRQNDVMEAIASEGVADVTELASASDGDWHLLTDIPELREKMESSLGVAFSEVHDGVVPTVKNLMTLGQHVLSSGGAVSALEASPVYLREQVASR